jgi:hypothetical protein
MPKPGKAVKPLDMTNMSVEERFDAAVCLIMDARQVRRACPS